MNSLAMAYLNLGEIAKAEKLAVRLEEYAREPSVKDTLRQIKMVKDELANPIHRPEDRKGCTVTSKRER